MTTKVPASMTVEAVTSASVDAKALAADLTALNGSGRL